MPLSSPPTPGLSPAPAPPAAFAAGPAAPPAPDAPGRTADASGPPRYWPTWAMLTIFVFMSFECIVLAAALKGRWFILVGPGVVCGVKAWEAWKRLQRAAAE